MEPVRRRGLAEALRSKPVAAVMVALAVVVLLGVAGTALLKKSQGDDKVDTAAAGAHLAQILDRVESGPAALEACPFDKIDAVFMAAPSELRPGGWQASRVVSGFSDDHRRAITCVADGNPLRVDSVKLAVIIGEPRRAGVADALRNDAGDLDINVTPAGKFQSGEIFTACATPKLQGSSPPPAYCTASFNGADLAIDVTSNGAGVTAELVATWLRESFDEVLAAIEATPVRASSTSTSTSSTLN